MDSTNSVSTPDSRPAKLVISQMKALKKLGIRHIIFFHHGSNSPEIVEALAQGPFKKKALPYWRKPQNGDD